MHGILIFRHRHISLIVNLVNTLPTRTFSQSTVLRPLKPHGNSLVRSGGGHPRRARLSVWQGVAIITPFTRPVRTRFRSLC